METRKNFFRALTVMAMASISLTMISCHQEDPTPTDTSDELAEQGIHRSVMHLNAAVPQFELGVTRASEAWQDGDKVYILFSDGDSHVDGQAVYDADEDVWEVEYSGSLSPTTDGKCELYFFDNAESSGNEAVTFTEHTVIFKDGDAFYLFDGSVISVTATLKPMTGRIRFKGTANQAYSFSGFDSYTNYNVKTNAFTSAPLEVTGATLDDGYTPYFYGFFPNEKSRKIVMYDQEDKDVKYSRILGAKALAVGESGYLDIPTKSSHKGWAMEEVEKSNNKTFTVTGNGKTVTFDMVFVQCGTFQMGQSSDGNDVTPVHTVTLTKDYYIGETEVTQALWYAVTGTSPWDPTYGDGDNYPANYITWNNCQTFLTALNDMTGENFRLPTEAEWEYAAKGGTKSKGYVYAGSDNIDEVSWYIDNCDGSTHEVKQKKANELGIYDMSGNVWEWCSDKSGGYSSDAQVDPTGPESGPYRMRRGGCWDDTWEDRTESSRVVTRAENTPSYPFENAGFRLVLVL